jgi:hypothetical protein
LMISFSGSSTWSKFHGNISRCSDFSVFKLTPCPNHSIHCHIQTTPSFSAL